MVLVCIFVYVRDIAFGVFVVFPCTIHTVSLQDKVGVGRIHPFIAG